jgi:hypothetical protein
MSRHERLLRRSVDLPGLEPVTGIGEESLLYTEERTSPEGPEDISQAAVRVGNDVATFSLYSTPGIDEAARGPTLELLTTVAGEI